MVALGIVLMVISLFLIPLGVPGLWIMVAVLGVGVWQGMVGYMVLATCIILAICAELIEWVIIRKFNLRYGGSRLAFWGAIAGGITGVIIGVPVPIVGSIVAGFAGSFVGAAAATYYETKQLDSATRVGFGIMMGKMWAAVTKVGAGVAILVLGAAALLL
jgi:uncharacterized protein